MALLNNTILEQVWLNGSNDFQQRIPQPTKSNMAQVQESIFAYRPAYNEFENALVNMIAGITFTGSTTWTNILGFLKRDGLINMGASIEEVAFDLAKATQYNVNAIDIFNSKNSVKAYSAFHTLDSQLRYDLTINQAEVRKAFLSDTGLSEYVSRKIAALAKSAEYDEYRQMVQLIAQAWAADGIYRVSTPFVDPSAPTADELKRLSQKVREISKKFSLVPTVQYNRKGVPQVSNQEDLVLLVTPEISSNLDVNVLADAFHIDRTDFVNRMVEIDEFPIPGVYAMLIDRNWFVVADYLRQVESIYNPANLSTNFFLHKWTMFSVSPFAQAAVFGEGSSTLGTTTIALTSIAAEAQENGDTVTDVEAGKVYDLVVSATGTITPASELFLVPSEYTVTWVADSEISTRTFVANGKIYIQDDIASGTEIVITVSSSYIDPTTGDKSTETATVTLTVA